MNENKNTNTGNIGADNEDLFAKRRPAAAPKNASPAYMQRRQESSRPAPDAQTVVRRPVQHPATPGQHPATPGQRPVAPGQRPAAPVQRPAAPVQRPASPAQKAEPAAPELNVKRAPIGNDTPAYKQRRATGTHSLIEKRNTAQSSADNKKESASPSLFKKKDEKEKKNDKQKSAKAGADMMVGIVKAIAYMVVVLVIAVFISIFIIRVGNDVFAFVKSDEAIDVTIPEDATVSDIAEILHDNGIISFPGIFKIYSNLKHEEGPFVAGEYTVSPSMSYDDLRYAFKEQVVTGTVWITIPEGYTCDEIIDLMVENGIGTRERYIDVINNYDFDYWFIDELEKNPPKDGRVYRLEGYLFPDTYEFYKASSEEKVIGRLLARFNEVFVEDYRTKAEELGFTVDEILIIASLVEKEAGGAGDFMYVSSVFHNRLRNSTYYPRLESDATTVYAIQAATGVRPDKITPEDNKFEHPYNTYINPGLTPGPITNPSASAIRYALYPAKTDYYYFITDNAGKVYYATGKTEHEKNIALVKQINEQLAER